MLVVLESGILFGLQSISLWLNLLSLRLIPVFLLLSVSFAVDWWDLLWWKPMPRSVCSVYWFGHPVSFSDFQIWIALDAKKNLFHSPTANHYNLRCVWTLGWFALMKLILFVVCAYSYKTMVVEIGPKGRGLVNARSLDDVILLWC
jgi:hypothetical protein